MRNKTKKLLFALFAAICVFLAAAGAADAAVYGDISVIEGEEPDVPALVRYDFNEESRATVSVLGIPLKNVSVSVFKETEVLAGGQSFGVKLSMHGVRVVGVGQVKAKGFTFEPAADAGLCAGDIITEADGKTIASAGDLTDIISKSGDTGVKLRYKRGDTEQETVLYPVKDENGEYKAGLWLKDSVAGIGTVTYISQKDNSFAGLGHGICEGDGEKLQPFGEGEVYDAHITGVKRGKNGEPGELRGYFENEPSGVLTDNTVTGVYGRFYEKKDGEPVRIALKDKVREGNVRILCTVDGKGVCGYDAKIIKILSYDTEEKNFIIKITDPVLLEKTGGIVQGMSGSPILQDGCLIGAVTHVLVNDPTKGYGIFIENMLDKN